MQIARVVIVRVIVDGVLGVTVDVHIGHDEVLVIYVAIFIVIFCNWRCTLYSYRSPRYQRKLRYAIMMKYSDCLTICRGSFS